MKQLATLNKYFIRYKLHLLGGLVFVVASNFFKAWQPQVIRDALDFVMGKVKEYKDSGNDITPENVSELSGALFEFGLMVIGLALLTGIFMYFMRQTIIVMSRLIEYDMRKEIYDHYQKLDISFYKKSKTGDLMSRITEDVNKVRMYLGPAILYGINLSSLFVLVVYSMLKVDVELTLYSLAPLPILSISIYYVSSLINKKSESIQIQLAKLNSVAQEVYSGIRVVKSYVQEIPMVNYFRKESDVFMDKSLEMKKIEALFFPLMLLLIGISTIITVYVGGLKVAAGELTTGNIAEFVIYVNMLTWPVTAIGWIASIIQQAAASQKRINEFLNTEPKIVNEVIDPLEIHGEIEFKKVSFTYPDTGIKALKNVSFSLKSGEKMAIIGKTGAGKTTIADLLLRMYDATSGDIHIDQQDIKKMDLGNLRHRIGYVPQDVFLFSDTVSDNVAFGKESAVPHEVEVFTRHAAVYEDIMELPEKFETIVGERGVSLSGGQKQRVSIARAFIKEPEIVILDDSLSAVDTSTEKKILGYLNGALSDKTAIIITHRIYSLLEFDKIIVLEDGAIVEEGTHETLLNNKGYYYDLFEMQQREEIEEEF